MKKILIILSSHDEMDNTNSKTGVWLGEFTDPYYEFVDKGFEITLASVKGGEPPLDPLSKLTKHITPSNRRFQNDAEAQAKFKNTKRLEELNPDGYDALFFPGGHGPMWDLANNEVSGKIILSFLKAQKPVAAVCHGPAAFLKAAELQKDLLKNKKMTAFTNAEELLVLRHKNIPYKLESHLKELGAIFHSALIPYASHVEEDGLLITGQNPMSAAPVARALINKITREA